MNLIRTKWPTMSFPRFKPQGRRSMISISTIRTLPYDVQLQFMKEVYDVLERGDGQIGILESPTGTVSSSHLPLHPPELI